MEDNLKIKVKNESSHAILIVLPDLRFKRTWSPGASISVTLEVLREAVFDKGFKHFLDAGSLYIESEEARIELGLQEEGGPAPKKALNKSQMLKLLKADPLEVFKKTMESFSREQCTAIADLAIEDKYLDVSKAKIIKDTSGIDIIKAVQLNLEG